MPADPSAPALKLEGLTKFYRRPNLGRARLVRGVEDVTLEVKRGEVFGLIGPNGSGKTTLIKLILGLLFPTSGHVEIDGSSALESRSRERIGFLPEVPYFYRTLTAREVLRFYGRLSGVPEKSLADRIESVLSRVRMRDHAHRLMREFSKGMLQRVGLAQAMLHDPDLLIFDEPVTGLDPVGLREMRELLVELNRAGKTIFFSSHSISEVEKVCHRVGMIVNGRLESVIEQAEWSRSGTGLEELFIRTVTRSGSLGVD
ncbi:MAG: hypothetical protein A2902_00895 [Elusimicrobia bacterium RIFCSPLOWO2_01_FULL_64_13]|nr:MAG: hypothetical protein A2636_01220 [Elusimicrobia bacterium RIFCSPHIGHO2_01_FULL_64_10]OGR97861.1 MAG: hypothetical protein A2902_00895 [Elusimicrobia bacterium RIFCSPLOWO2_01_FULL_64_13]